ncbi:LPS export ABC transporter permease LptG [Croceibacterium sp. TMG7-5b_MA50]|uniref:LPS export ABC transporter permease LptG n=1 Tax=Croceibacterium sp. TMG7-5b_MA50 TaxID=3121290 RepID=UPI003221924F
MLFDFFPSRRLTWYLGKTFLSRIVAVLAMLVLVLMMLDLLGTSGDILAVPGNTQADVLRYVGWRLPQLVAQFLPYSVLLATIITLLALNQNSEVTAMKAAGMSAHQILAPLLLTAGLLSLSSFLFNELVVTRATAQLAAWEANDFGPIPDDPTVRGNVYLNDGPDILLAATAAGRGAATVLTGVTFYDRDDELMIRRRILADSARYTGAGWRLENPRIFEVDTAAAARPVPSMVVAPGLTPGRLDLRPVNPDAEPIGVLSESIAMLDAAGRDTSELRGRWWHKISGPLAALLMPLLGAVAGFGLARSGGLFVRAIIGMALGFAYFVVDNAALAMGSFGGYSPLLSAWAPFVLFALIGETVLIRTEE